jgi:hypothetical protein
MATIIIRNSTGSGAVPPSLQQGELAINTKDGKLFYGSGSGNIVKEFTGSGGGGSIFPYTGSAGISGSLNVNGPFTASSALISGNVTVLGTASINTLIVNQIGYSSGSNQLGDAANDTQTLFGTVVIPTGSLTVSGNVSFGTSSAGFYWDNTNGYLGIKKTTPAVEIDVVGSIRATSTVFNSTTQTQNIQINSGVSALRFLSGSVETARYDGNNWGFYTTAPTARLHIKGSGATSATTTLRVENTNASASLVVLDDGAVGIGTTSPSSSILLDVSGSIRSFNILPASTGNWDIGVSANRFRNGWFNGALVAVSTYTNNLLFGVTNLGIYSSTGTQIAQMFGTGDLVLQSGGTFTNNNYRLQVNATGSTNSGSLFLGGTTIATSSIARTMLISSSLSASANSDVLVGLDINPSFNTGSFTGVQPVALRLPSIGRITNATTGGGYNVYITNSEATLNSPSTSGIVGFQLGYTFVGRFMATTGNFIIQNGGTFTDAGFRLDVSGSARITNNLTVTGSTILNNGQTTIKGAGATSATTTLIVQNSTPTNIITVLDNGTVGILRAPTASLDIAGTIRISGSFNTAASGSILTVIGSGSTQPIFTVQGSQGELFSITDSLTGSLFSVNDISGLPILEVFSDSTTLIGDYQDPMLITTKKVTMTNSGSFVVYSLPTASYDTAFFDYSIKSGSNARAGQIMAIQSGTSVNFTETTTTDFGNTTAVSFTVIVSGSNMVLTGSAATGSWTIKSIIRGL